MKKKYLSPEWKLVDILSYNILNVSDDTYQDGDSWTKDY